MKIYYFFLSCAVLHKQRPCEKETLPHPLTFSAVQERPKKRLTESLKSWKTWGRSEFLGVWAPWRRWCIDYMNTIQITVVLRGLYSIHVYVFVFLCACDRCGEIYELSVNYRNSMIHYQKTMKFSILSAHTVHTNFHRTLFSSLRDETWRYKSRDSSELHVTIHSLPAKKTWKLGKQHFT
jgi:hypothetical protein